MKILYFDCFAGISGDMTIGALLDLGVDGQWLAEELKKLNLPGYRLEIGADEKKGIHGIRFKVVITDVHGQEAEDPGLLGCTQAGTPAPESTAQSPDEHARDAHKHDHHHHDHSHHHHDHHHHHHDKHHHHHDHDPEHPHHNEPSHDHHSQDHSHEHAHSYGSYTEIRQLILDSTLDEAVKATALKIFHRIARAEAKVHGQTLETVHFHEVGAIDSIVDIVGVALCLHALDADRIYCSPVHAGSGFIKCAHGFMPVPAPATLEIFTESDLRPYATHLKGEFTTPTGAAILAEIATPADGLPAVKVLRTGYGAGTKDFDIPNMLRVILAEHPDEPEHPLWVLEANMDDTTGEMLGYVLESLLEAGALDAYYTAVQMKKNRPGTLLTVLCTPERVNTLEALILKETTTLGLRRHRVTRTTFHRHMETVTTPWGPVAIKVAHWQDTEKITPEFEDCRRIAREQGITLRVVMDAALDAAKGLIKKV